MALEEIGTPASWVGFVAFILAMLALDLGFLRRKAHEVSIREAAAWTAVWIALSLIFNLGLYVRFGPEPALEFLSAYLVEKALSVDNIFVFIVVFSAFEVPRDLQHRVLLWGVLGALAMRAMFIGIGAALLHQFHWIEYLFGAFLVFTGVKLFGERAGASQSDRNPVVSFLRRVIPSVDGYREGRFTVVEGGRRYATPLLLVLLSIEATDLVFATDSIPAIFAVSTDPFIVFTSNVFAILGLRSLYFALAGMIGKFYYLKHGLSAILVFIGGKMLIGDLYKIPVAAALGVVVLLLVSSVLVSLLRPPKQEPKGMAEKGDSTRRSAVT